MNTENEIQLIHFAILLQLLETEDIADAENKELVNRMESLESIVRMLELKHKNSLDHASRLEEREADFKKVLLILIFINIQMHIIYIYRNIVNYTIVIQSYLRLTLIIWSVLK